MVLGLSTLLEIEESPSQGHSKFRALWRGFETQGLFFVRHLAHKITWIFIGGKCTTSSFLVWYGNRHNYILSRATSTRAPVFGAVNITHTIILLIPIPNQKAGSCAYSSFKNSGNYKEFTFFEILTFFLCITQSSIGSEPQTVTDINKLWRSTEFHLSRLCTCSWT